MQRTDSLKKTDAGKDWRQEEKGMTEDEMVEWYHWINGHKFEQTPGAGDRETWCAAVHGFARVGHDWVTEWLNWMLEDFLTHIFNMTKFYWVSLWSIF